MSHYSTVRVPEAVGRQLHALGLSRAPLDLGEMVALSAEAQGPLNRPEDLCCASASAHEIHIGGETRYTYCVLDSLMLPLVVGQSALVRSRSPHDNTVVELRVDSEGVHADSPDVVVSFGVRRDGSGSFYDLACPYINAFRSMDDYESWAATVPEAETMALRLVDAFELARDLTGTAT